MHIHYNEGRVHFFNALTPFFGALLLEFSAVVCFIFYSRLLKLSEIKYWRLQTLLA